MAWESLSLFRLKVGGTGLDSVVLPLTVFELSRII